jgi:aerobic carbon-monoxide dehydrogenase large subunit
MGVRQFGARVTRFEDPALLAGCGRFVDDIAPEGALHACFVRSPVAHATIRSVDSAEAKSMPGVHAVLTAADLPEPMRSGRIPTLQPNPAMKLIRTQHCLALDEVAYVGQPVAVVVADSRQFAEDAAAFVTVDYGTLPVAAETRDAAKPDSAVAHSDLADNVAGSVQMAYGDVAAAFAAAAHTVEETFAMHRGAGMPMETRGVIAETDPADGRLTVWSATQTPHLGRRILADLLDRDAESIRLVAPDVGGGFGIKAPFYPEEAVIPAAALILGRPVKWIEDRRENFLSATQERDQHWTLALALGAGGNILGLRGEALQEQGAFMPWGLVMPYIAGVAVLGPYVIPNYRLDVTVAVNNKAPVAPVRGAGRPQAVFAIERLMDRAAQALGIGRDEFRLRNMVAPGQMPYATGLVLGGKPVTYRSGDFPGGQAMAMEAAGYGDFPARQVRAREHGRYIGIGLANYVEGTGLGPYEGATVRIMQNGKVAVATGATSQGQGTRTTIAQIVADRLGCRIEDVVVTLGDTAAIAMGVGAFASRQAIAAGSAAHNASVAVREQIVALAARALGIPPSDIDVEDGRATARTGNRPSLTFGELARMAQGIPGVSFPDGQSAGLEHTAYFHPPGYSFCNGTHIVEAEVDPMTGGVSLRNYIVAHDCGTVINPMVVDGQVHGGAAHGIGNALFERMEFDDDANPLTTTFQDYLLPAAPEVPAFQVLHVESPNPLNPLGVKGAGEGGAIPAPAAVIGAVEDALSPFGVRFSEFPLTPEAIVRALRAAGAYETLASS